MKPHSSKNEKYSKIVNLDFLNGRRVLKGPTAKRIEDQGKEQRNGRLAQKRHVVGNIRNDLACFTRRT